MSDKVELIKQEIERLKHNTPNAYDLSRFMLLEEIEDFIDSLPKESGCEANCTTRRSDDLEEEIRQTAGDYEQVDVAWNNDFDFIAHHFAEWQKKKDVEEMMKTLVEGEIVKDIHNQLKVTSEPLNDTFGKIGDRVKIMIVKED